MVGRYSARFGAEIARVQATHWFEGSVAEIGVPSHKIYLTREPIRVSTSLNCAQRHEKDSQMFGVPVAISDVEPKTHRLRKRLNSAAGPRLVAAERRRLRVATGR
jgi:hypothetical protein